MADIFLQDDALKCLRGKSVVFLGDSIMRNIYQDFVTLLFTGKMSSHEHVLKKKGEMIPRYYGDRLVPGTGRLTKGRNFREERETRLDKDDLVLRYYFLTQCWNSEVKRYLERSIRYRDPDLILVLSCLWDVNRWGPGGIKNYKANCEDLLRYVRKEMSSSTQLVWLTCPPISTEVRGGVVVDGMDVRGMRFNVMEANLMVATNTAAHGYDVLDLHYHMMHQVHKRMPDGVHWTQAAVRFQVNHILTHWCLSRDLPLPHRDRSSYVTAARKMSDAAEEGPVTFVKKGLNGNDSNKRKKDSLEVPFPKKSKLDEVKKGEETH